MFRSARLKIDRAKQHIRDLKAALNRYSQSARLDFRDDGSSVTINIDHRAEPTCSLVIGDAIHNLRSTLDHAFWELMEIDGGTQNKYTSFPVHLGGQIAYEASCNGIRTPRSDTKKFFIGIAAYPDGIGDILATIHELDITDKHSLLTPVFGLTSLRNCVIIRPDGTREDWDAIGVPYTSTIIGVDGTATIEPFGVGRFEQNNKTDAALDILFGDFETTVELKPVMPVLNSFAAEVLSVVDRMERFVSERV